MKLTAIEIDALVEAILNPESGEGYSEADLDCLCTQAKAANALEAQLQQSAERERVLREALEKIDDWTLDGTHDFKHTYTSPHPYDGPTLEEHTTTCRGCEADEQLQQVIDIIDAALAQSASKETDNV